MITHQPPHTLANLDTLLPRGDLVVSPLAIPMIDDLRPPPGSVFQVCTVYPFLPSPHLCDRPRRCWRLQVSLVSPWPAHTAAAGECEYPAVETIVPCSFGRGLMRVGFFTSRSKIKCLGGSPCGNCQRVGHDAICEYAPVPLEINRAERHKKAISRASKRPPLAITTMAPNPTPPTSCTPFLVFTYPPDLLGFYDHSVGFAGQPVDHIHFGQLPSSPPTSAWPDVICRPWATPPPTSPVQSPTIWGSPQWPWSWDPSAMPVGSQIPEPQCVGLGLGIEPTWYPQGEVFPDTVVGPQGPPTPLTDDGRSMGHTACVPWSQMA
jgi:hypothetical protein